MQVNLDSKELGGSRDCLCNRRTYCNSGEKSGIAKSFPQAPYVTQSAIVAEHMLSLVCFCHKIRSFCIITSLQLNEMVRVWWRAVTINVLDAYLILMLFAAELRVQAHLPLCPAANEMRTR